MTAPALLDESLLRQLEVLALALRRPAPGALRGAHRSRRSGAGMVFSDYRAYSPGDDVRHLDWSAYLRLDRLVLRLFEQEADLPVHLLVDASASMAFGAPSKFDHARRLAGALAYVALSAHDRVDVAALAGGGVRRLPTRRGRNRAAQVLQFLGGLEAGGSTRLAASLRACAPLLQARGLVVLLSDFLDPAGTGEAFTLLARLGHEVALVHLSCPEEREPRGSGPVTLEDAEDGSVLEVDLGPALLQAYRAACDRHRAALQATCRRHGWALVSAGTEIPVQVLVLRALREQGLLR